jgi:hypothetical protein
MKHKLRFCDFGIAPCGAKLKIDNYVKQCVNIIVIISIDSLFQPTLNKFQ